MVKIKIDDSKSSSRCLRYSSSSCNWRLRETRILRQRAQEHRVRGPSLGDSQRTVFSPGYPTESTGGSSTGWRERLLCSVMRNLKKWMVQYFSAHNAAGSLQGHSMCSGGERNIISTACGEDISSNFVETALLCDAVGSPKVFLGGLVWLQKR